MCVCVCVCVCVCAMNLLKYCTNDYFEETEMPGNLHLQWRSYRISSLYRFPL